MIFWQSAISAAGSKSRSSSSLLVVAPVARDRARAREVADDRLVLPHVAFALAGDVAGRDVDEPRAELAREVEHVLRAHRVDAQRALERRRERHQAGAVDDDVDAACASISANCSSVKLQSGAADVAGDRDDLRAHERLVAGAVHLAHRIEHLARRDLRKNRSSAVLPAPGRTRQYTAPTSG